MDMMEVKVNEQLSILQQQQQQQQQPVVGPSKAWEWSSLISSYEMLFTDIGLLFLEYSPSHWLTVVLESDTLKWRVLIFKTYEWLVCFYLLISYYVWKRLGFFELFS